MKEKILGWLVTNKNALYINVGVFLIGLLLGYRMH